jgi:hypothetical protein
MRDCDVKIGLDTKQLLEAIAAGCELEFIGKDSKPANSKEVIVASHHILKNISYELMGMAGSKNHLAMFARFLGLDKFLDAEKELNDIFKTTDVDEEIKDILRSMLDEIRKK